MDPERLATALKTAIDTAVTADSPDPADGWRQIERRLGRRRSQRTGWLAAAIAAAATVTAIALVSVPHHSAATFSATTGQLRLLSQARLPGAGPRLAVGYGAVWIPATGLTYQVDQDSGRVVRRIPTPGTGRGCGGGVAAGGGWVWVSYGCHGDVYRIDPRTGRNAGPLRTDMGSGPIAFASGVLWVATTDGALLRIDPVTGRELGGKIPVVMTNWYHTGKPAVISAIVAGPRAVWADLADGTVVRVDAITVDHEPIQHVAVDPTHIGAVAAVGAGWLWVPGSAVMCYDSRTFAWSATFIVPGGRPTPADASVAYWRGQAWALTWRWTQQGTVQRQALHLYRLDPASQSVISRTPIRGSALPGLDRQPAAIIAGPTGLWVIDARAALLSHLGLG